MQSLINLELKSASGVNVILTALTYLLKYSYDLSMLSGKIVKKVVVELVFIADNSNIPIIESHHLTMMLK